MTSALLEYSIHDKAAFYLNGTPILDRSDFEPNDYEALSTADGGLPAQLLEAPGANLLASEDYEIDSGLLALCYRLTIRRSAGDPIVVWSDPDHVKMLHLGKGQENPEGWNLPGFDDSAWVPAVAGTDLESPAGGPPLPILTEKAFAGVFGLQAFVPILSDLFSFASAPRDRNLYRESFLIPDLPQAVGIRVDKPEATQGQTLRVDLVPGADALDYGAFKLVAWLPQGLKFLDAKPGYTYKPEQGQLSWSVQRKDLHESFAVLSATSVLDAGGWSQPDLALGGPKAGKARRQLNVSDYDFNHAAARFTANRPAWFRMSPSGVDLTAGRPAILGVLFRTQLRLGGSDDAIRTDADLVELNYSVDGREEGALRKNARVSHGMDTNGYWFDAYYEASGDRPWTWEDLDHLAVMIRSKARGTVCQNLLASVVATVRYASLEGADAWFEGQVSAADCASLPLRAEIQRLGKAPVPSEPSAIRANPALCAPGPSATPTSLPLPSPTGTPGPGIPAPAQSATPGPGAEGKAMASEDYFHLGCLATDPEPFNYAGTFLSFCLGRGAVLALKVYDAAGGKLLRSVQAGAFSAGQGQIFFNALDADGKALAPGAYQLELEASDGNHKGKADLVVHCLRR